MNEDFEFDQLAREIHRANVEAGWWDDMNRCIHQVLQLVVTELAEATEGERKDLMDDHLPHRKMGEVELADTLIRLFDLAGRYNWSHIPDVTYDQRLDRIDSIAGKHLVCVRLTCRIIENFEFGLNPSFSYTMLVNSVMRIGELQGYDIMAAVREKREYNKHRADHKRENRAAAGGKKF